MTEELGNRSACAGSESAGRFLVLLTGGTGTAARVCYAEPCSSRRSQVKISAIASIASRIRGERRGCLDERRSRTRGGRRGPDRPRHRRARHRPRRRSRARRRCRCRRRRPGTASLMSLWRSTSGRGPAKPSIQRCCGSSPEESSPPRNTRTLRPPACQIGRRGIEAEGHGADAVGHGAVLLLGLVRTGAARCRPRAGRAAPPASRRPGSARCRDGRPGPAPAAAPRSGWPGRAEPRPSLDQRRRCRRRRDGRRPAPPPPASPHSLHQALALRGQAPAARQPIEQPRLQRRLQRVDPAGDGGVLDAQPARGGGQRAGPRQCEEVADVTPFYLWLQLIHVRLPGLPHGS